MMTSKDLYLRLLGYFKPYRTIAGVTILLMAISGGIEALMVRLLKDLVDGFDAIASGTQPLWYMPAILFVVALARMFAGYGYEYTSKWLSSRITYDLRSEMYTRLLRLPVAVYDKSSVGELLSRVTYDVNGVMSAGLQVITTAVRDGVLAIGLLVILFYTDWQLAMFCALLIPGVGLSMRLVAKRQRRLSLETQDSMGALARILNETLGGHRVVKIFSGQDYEAARFLKINQMVRRLTVKRAATTALNAGFNLFLVAVVIGLVVYYAGLRALHGGLTAGDFIAFMGAMLMLQQPVKSLTRINDELQRGLAAAQTVFSLLDQPMEQDTGLISIDRAKGAITLREVGFKYLEDAQPVLQGINLDIRPGETVAFVGQSGSGKTTLINLIARFYHGHTGEILLDGVSIHDYRLADYRRQYAMVGQDTLLFNDTVAANIAYADPKPDPARVRAAAEAAFAADFIEQLPGGYEEVLGEDGVRLSGGQRQRLAIARAVYSNAPILMLDEATSALDTEAERLVQGALERLMENRTTLVIAHRLSTIENADRIVVMQRGRIVEEGNHKSLMARGGVYAAMHAVQFQEGVIST
ncbi:MAG: lipid A export permease/ATP-binding protein MsbA [Pseudomonadota bacterium]